MENGAPMQSYLYRRLSCWLLSSDTQLRSNSERDKNLRIILATLFITPGFSSSLLGMNIDLLEQNAVKFW